MKLNYKQALAFLIGILLLTACNERYFQFSKVRASKKKGVFKLHIDNQSPAFLDKDFETSLKEFAIKRLEKKGYQYSEKTAKKEFVIQLSIDSATKITTVFTGPSPAAAYYKGYSKAINFRISCINLNSGNEFWNDEYRACFYLNPVEDLHRAKSLIRFLLNGIPEL